MGFHAWKKVTVYHLDRPGAWGQFGLGALLFLIPFTSVVVFAMPGVFFALFPNAPRQPDPWGTTYLGAVALAVMGTGVYFLYTAVRTLRDRAPKLEFTAAGIIDHRGRTTVEWGRIAGVSFFVEKTGDRISRAVITLTVVGEFGTRGVDIDLRGLSRPPESIFARLKRLRGLA
jgi:hypothetical protein